MGANCSAEFLDPPQPQGEDPVVPDGEDLKYALRQEWREIKKRFQELRRGFEDEIDRQCHRQELLVARWVESAAPSRTEEPMQLSLPQIRDCKGPVPLPKAFDRSSSDLLQNELEPEPAPPVDASPPRPVATRPGWPDGHAQGPSPAGPPPATVSHDLPPATPAQPSYDSEQQTSDKQKPKPGLHSFERMTSDQLSSTTRRTDDEFWTRALSPKGSVLSTALSPTAGGRALEGHLRIPDKANENEVRTSQGSRTRVPQPMTARYVKSMSVSPHILASLECGRAPIRVALYRNFSKYLEEWAEEPERRGCLAPIVDHRLFDMFCAFVILCNGLFSVYTTNYEMLHLNDGPSMFIDWVESAFTCFYVVEIVARFYVHKAFFFYSWDWHWNVFDAVTVTLAFADVLWRCAVGRRDASANLTFMRAIRFLKMAKVLKVVRMLRFFLELRLILSSLSVSIYSLFWSVMMLALTYFGFSLIFVQAAASRMRAMGVNPTTVQSSRFLCTLETPGDPVCIVATFGSVQDAMMTLFLATTGGEDWQVFFWVVCEFGTLSGFTFVAFIVFVEIALMNILTGIFVEGALKLAQPDRETLALDKRRTEITLREELLKLFEEMDIQGKGWMSLEDLASCFKFGKLKAHLSLIDLNVQDTWRFFSLLCLENENQVSAEEFVDGCVRLKGAANNMDLQLITVQMQEVMSHLREVSFRLNQGTTTPEAQHGTAVRTYGSTGAFGATSSC